MTQGNADETSSHLLSPTISQFFCFAKQMRGAYAKIKRMRKILTELTDSDARAKE